MSDELNYPVRVVQKADGTRAWEEGDRPSELPSSTGSAEDRGMALLTVPMKNLPPIALEFARHLCNELGMCIEVFLTAYTVYAQCVEGLPCTDSLYKARPDDIEWFKLRSTLPPNAKISNSR